MIRTIGFRRLAAAAVALIALSPFADALAQKSVTVLANYTFHGRHSPFFVALDKGYFTEAGFKADVQPATGSGFVISAIESGKADYGLADASTTMQAIAKGSKVKGFQVYMDISTNGLASLTPICDCYTKQSLIRPFGKIIGLNGWLKEYAAQSGAVYLDYYSAMTEGRNLKKELTDDGLLPNDAGYTVMAPLAEEAIARALGRK